MKIEMTLFKLAEVLNYMDTKGISFDPHYFDLFLSIEETRPYDQLTANNTYIQTQDVATLMDTQAFREMECEVCQLMVEKRWFHKLNQDSKNSIIF